jgi:hypothetical protein
MILQVYVDPQTEHVLRRISAATGRSMEELAEAAVAEEACRSLPTSRSPVVHPLDLGSVTIGMREQPDGSMEIVG